jgi:hypothetical protein
MDSRCGLGGRSRDDTASDPVAGVACGVGLHVVALLVNDDGGSPVGENAVSSGRVHREIVDVEGSLAEMAFADGDIGRQVARVVSHRILEAVLLIVGVEVAAGGLEVRRVAERFGVDVDAVLAYGQVLEIKLDVNTFLRRAEGCGARVLAGGGLNGDDNGVLWFGEGWNDEKTESDGGEYAAHGMVLQITYP